MMRSAIVIYLMLATLVGPRPCQCAVSSAEHPSPSIPLNTVPQVCGCCNTSNLTSSTASQAPGQQRPDQPSAPCHCQCGKQDTVATVRAVARAANSSLDYDGYTESVHTCGVLYSAPVQHVFGLGHLCNSPFYTTDDILYGFHRLRC